MNPPATNAGCAASSAVFNASLIKGHQMRNPKILVVALCLMLFLVSCTGPDLTTSLSPDTKDTLATLVSATLTSISSESAPAESTAEPNGAMDTSSSVPVGVLADFPDRTIVGENDTHSVYLINRSGGTDSSATGELIIQTKGSDQVSKLNGIFSVILGGGTLVFDDGKGEYLLLSIGTYSTRTGIVISLVDQKQAVNDFCLSSGQYGSHIFWEGLIFINNCDTQNNRPWGRGEAASIIAINLVNGEEIMIAQSDLTHQYSVKIIEGNMLRYTDTFVENETDWQSPDKQRSDEKSYDLTLIGSN
jgi:hypothetical protein